MHPSIIQQLRRQKRRIKERWEAFLRIEEVTSPLAHPDILVFGVDRSLREIFSALARPRLPKGKGGQVCECACGRHPLRAYYRAGEQAVLEALVWVQAGCPPPPQERDSQFAEVKEVLTALAQRDLDALARLCQLPPVEEQK